MTESVGSHKTLVDATHAPTDLRDEDVWVVWSPEWGKTARAPWQEGTLYPCTWAESRPEDPRRPFAKARATADLPPEELERQYAIPDDHEWPAPLKPAVLLPHEWGDRDPILFVDFDDVRDPDTGAVPEEVWELVQRLGGPAEVSRSGEGLHVWVRAELPPGHGKVIEDLDTQGQIEMYDHGRMTGGTWRHVAGTPRDDVPAAQATVEAILEEYGALDGEAVSEAVTAGDDPGRADASSGGGDRSPYFNLSIRQIADRGPFRRYRDDGRNPATDDWQGPHPAHGGTSTSDRASANCNVKPSSDQWYCFAHGSGGGPLALIAVLEGVVSCANATSIYDDRQQLLETCLYARDQYAALEDAAPPYDALYAAAEEADLQVADAETGILGEDAHRLARIVYDELGPAEVASDR